MNLPAGSRERVFIVEEHSFWVLGDPNVPDERTALGWRRRYAPDAPIEGKWIERRA